MRRPGIPKVDTPTNRAAMDRWDGRRRILRWIGAVLAGLLAIIIFTVYYMAWNIEGDAVGSVQKMTTSRDGTTIAYETTGAGPVVVLVSAALADRGGTRRLAKQLAKHFTVINYDRRGRGKSTDTQPYAVEREVEDVEALIDASGGSAFLFGSSSGAVLALEAASKLDGKVKKLFMYEPPFIVDDSRPPMPDDFGKQITELVAAGRPGDSVKLFFTKGMGIPNFAVTLMRLLPGWSKMTGMAPTLPYDLAILAGTQTGKPLPASRWASMTPPTLVVVGSRSEAFFHQGAKALVGILLNAQYRSLDGGNHGAVLLAPKAIAAVAEDFFPDRK
jgi:pimeloyl-ACP methyl ester carboxylesterase